MAKPIEREYGFLFCVGAEQELARLCPGGDLTRMKEHFAGNNAAAIDFGVELICILSKWHEKARALELGAGCEQRPLTKDEILLLPLPAFKQLQAEALAAMARDGQQTVEAEPEKKRSAPKSS